MPATVTPTPLGLLVRRWPERRPVVIAVAFATLVAVLAGVVVAHDPELGIGFLGTVPIMLVALECGQRAGLAFALVAFGAILVLAADEQPALGAAAIALRGFAYFAAALAAGRFSDRMRAAHETEERLLRSGLRLSEVSRRERLPAIALAEAMGSPRALGAAVGIDGVDEARAGAEEGTRTVVPMAAHGVHVGTIEVFHDGGPEPEELAALRLLARQTAIVAESLRLLDLDGERAALETRLREVRRELLESRSGAGLVLRAEEEGKRRAAEKLHEDLAQVLSAVLLGMRMLERNGGDGSEPLKDLQEQVARVLSDVRDVARELRPVVLDQLGLAPALEALGRAARDRGSQASVAVGALPETLPDEVETAVFRLIEDALLQNATVIVEEQDGEIVIGIGIDAPTPEAVLALRARAESAGGTVTTSAPAGGPVTALRVTVPAR